MLKYLNNLYNYIWTYFYVEDQSPKFEKPRGYKNIACHELRKSNSQ